MTTPVRLRPEIAALPPYRQGKQASPDAFKLSSNENPFEPLPSVVEAVRGAVSVVGDAFESLIAFISALFR